MAHYHMGGIRCNARMESDISGLFGAGEVVGGAHGANRLSGNALTGAFVFGERAGRFASEYARSAGAKCWDWEAADAVERRVIPHWMPNTAPRESSGVVISQLQVLMGDLVGSIRNSDGLTRALAQIHRWQSDWASMNVREAAGFNLDLQDWCDLRNMLTAAEATTLSALTRRESRGAHFRADFPEMDPTATANILLRLQDGVLSAQSAPVVTTGLEVIE
jgi:succinate dehydrogenase/fumarate reductase flavoprotein subunit